jgi:hypothetical protein
MPAQVCLLFHPVDAGLAMPLHLNLTLTKAGMLHRGLPAVLFRERRAAAQCAYR